MARALPLIESVGNKVRLGRPMLKQILSLMLFAGAFATPALAQDASKIARVQDGQSCKACNLFQADLAYKEAKKIDLSGSRLRQSDLSLSTYDEVNFKTADLSLSNLFGARFNRVNFTGANLQKAVAVGTYFGASDFTRADLAGANFSGADLSIAKGLTQAQLNTACGDDTTKLPKRKTIPSCS